MDTNQQPAGPGAESGAFSDDPDAVLALLEADQVVAVKQRSRFQRRPLSRGLRVTLWALRIYVLVMLVMVAISVYRAV